MEEEEAENLTDSSRRVTDNRRTSTTNDLRQSDRRPSRRSIDAKLGDGSVVVYDRDGDVSMSRCRQHHRTIVGQVPGRGWLKTCFDGQK